MRRVRAAMSPMWRKSLAVFVVAGERRCGMLESRAWVYPRR